MNNDWEKQFKQKLRRVHSRQDALYYASPIDDVEIDTRYDLRASSTSMTKGREPSEFLLDRDLDDLYRIIEEDVDDANLCSCLKLPYHDILDDESPINSNHRAYVFQHILEDNVTVEEFYNETVGLLKPLRITERAMILIF